MKIPSSLAVLAFLLIAACAHSLRPLPGRPGKSLDGRGGVWVTANALNVRHEPSTSSDVIAQVVRGDRLDILGSEGSWSRVKISGGAIGWVASQYLSGQDPGPRHPCTPDSPLRFLHPPRPDLSVAAANHGLVVVEAEVDIHGDVISSRVVSNATGDDALGKEAMREISSAQFVAPIHSCQSRSVLYKYKRSF